MNMIEALNALKKGELVTNKHWNKYQYLSVDDEGRILFNNCYGDEYTFQTDVLNNFFEDDWKIYEEPYITIQERDVLASVIRYFRSRVIFISKIKQSEKYAYIIIGLSSKGEQPYDTIKLPLFIRNKEYKNMEINKKYSLEDLDLSL